MKRAARSRQPIVRSAREGTCEVDLVDDDAVASARAHVAEAGHIDALADRLGVLGNPARLRLVVALAQQELCVCDCARLIGQSLSAASQHLKELRRIGAVRFRQDGRLAYYRIADDRWLRHIRILLDEFTRSHVAAT